MDVRVMVSARGRAQADAQGRGDGAGSVTDRQTRTLRRSLRVFVWLHQGGEAPERRPWASKRERPPGCFCPALRREVFQSSLSRVRVRFTEAAA
jgi:hypothetical protein